MMEKSVRSSAVSRPRVKGTSGDRPKRLQVYRSWCKRCGICVALCPKGALEKDAEGFPRWRDSKACVACRMCELRCPDFAIEVEEEGRTDEQAK